MILKGGYAMLDLTAVVAAGETGADIAGIFKKLDTIKPKPVLVTYYESGELSQQAWFTISKVDDDEIILMGTVVSPETPTSLAAVFDVTDEDHVTFTVETIESDDLG